MNSTLRILALGLALVATPGLLPSIASAQESDEPAAEAAPSESEASEASEEPASDEEMSGFEKALAKFDGLFGEWVVGPMAGVFFLDVWAWDGARRPGSVDAAPDYAMDSAEEAVVLNLVNGSDEETLEKLGLYWTRLNLRFRRPPLAGASTFVASSSRGARI